MHETSGLLDPSPTTTLVAVSKEGSEVLKLLGTWEYGWPVLGLQEIDRIRVGCSGLARARSGGFEEVLAVGPNKRDARRDVMRVI